jgi:mRNA-degrading endonuclease RelE of RelBE toxin-antitoxin system
VSRYRLWIEDAAKAEVQRLPGHVRQRVKRAIAALADEPRPANSRPLAAPAELPLELRRVRIEGWRIVYAIDAEEASVGVYAVRQRPPYDYKDLTRLLKGSGG